MKPNSPWQEKGNGGVANSSICGVCAAGHLSGEDLAGS